MATLTGWLGNRADAPVELEINEALAREFMASTYYSPEGPIRRALVNWLAFSDGKNIAWDPDDPTSGDAIDALYDQIRHIERSEGGPS